MTHLFLEPLSLDADWEAEYWRNDQEVAELNASSRPSQHCVCGTDMPGTCPGPTNCPYSGDDE